jgi:hypothetical protein
MDLKKHGKNIMFKLMLFLSLFFSYVPYIAQAQEVLVSKHSLVPPYVQTPRDLSIWMTNNFTYQPECDTCDYWKTPEETLRDKGGDCEDFAIFAKTVLKEWGIKSHIIVLEFYDERDDMELKGHAFLVYYQNSTLYVFDNTTLSSFPNISHHQIIIEKYPFWKRYAVTPGIKGIYYNWVYNRKLRNN